METKAKQYGSPNNKIRRYPTNLRQRPVAERYAEQIEMSLPALGLAVAAKEWADELRRLSRVENELQELQQQIKDSIEEKKYA